MDLEQARRVVRQGAWLTAVAAAGAVGIYVLALGFTPPDIRQGLAQKIFYVHAPAAWAALMAFTLVGIASGLYLWLDDPRLDRFAASRPRSASPSAAWCSRPGRSGASRSGVPGGPGMPGSP